VILKKLALLKIVISILYFFFGHLPMNAQKEKVADEFSLWKRNMKQVGDVTIIGIRI